MHKQVHILGAMTRDQALPIIASHWVFCQHSVTSLQGDQEGFANSPAEAALLGLPVVSTWHNGIPEHVIHELTGFLVREFDFEEMANRMMQLIESEDLRVEMGRKGKESIIELCDPSVRVGAVRQLLTERLPMELAAKLNLVN